MEIQIPEGCALVAVELEAETHEAFDAAAGGRTPSTIGPITRANKENGAYTFRLVYLQEKPHQIKLRSPERNMKLVDA